LQDLEALCKWRDAHAPGKPVWITEFGYDSSTKTANGESAKWVGVSDTQQAQWLVRSLLVFSAMPVQRAYVYFFNDEDQPSVHASSGITRHFKPKPAFHALRHLQRVLGDCRYARTVQNEAEGLRVQEYRSDAGTRVWVVWLASGKDQSRDATLQHLPGKVALAERMPLGPETPACEVKQDSAGNLEVRVDESPVYLVFGS
jgi:serine/threonine-protein kinase ATR